MPILSSIRARSPSPAPQRPFSPTIPLTPPSHDLCSTPPQVLPPTIRLVSATPASSTNIPAPAIRSERLQPVTTLQPAKRLGGSKRTLVAKKSGLVLDTTPLQPALLSSKPSLSSSSRVLQPDSQNYIARTIDASLRSTFKPPAEWDVVQPPPPPRNVASPHQFASARRVPAPSLRPVAILPVKTNDGSSKENDPSRISSASIRAAKDSVRSVRSSDRLAGSQSKGSKSLKVFVDEPEQLPILVKKKKSRLALDLGWALGDRTNSAPKESRSSTPTLKKQPSNGRLSPESGSENGKDKDDQGKEKWKWSVSGMVKGRGRKEGSTAREVFTKRSKSPSPAPPAIRNIPTFAAASSAAGEYTYRSPSLDSFPPSPAPPAATPFSTMRSVSAPLHAAPQERPPSSASNRLAGIRTHQRTSSTSSSSHSSARHVTIVAPPVRPKDQHPRLAPLFPVSDSAEDARPVTPRVPAPRHMRSFSNVHGSDATHSSHHEEQRPTSFYEKTETPKNGSLALRAMRSVRSMARISGWGTLKGLSSPAPDAEGNEDTISRSKSKKIKKHKSRGSLMSFSVSETPQLERRGSILDFIIPDPVLADRRKSSASNESWLVGAPSQEGSPTPERTRSNSDAASMISLNQRIISESAREAHTYADVGEAIPRPSGETFGNARLDSRRSSQERYRNSTLSTGSGVSTFSHVSSSSRGSRLSDASRSDGRCESIISQGGQPSLASPTSTMERYGINRPSSEQSRSRAGLTSLFDGSGSTRSGSASSHRTSVASSRASSGRPKGSADSTGSRGSSNASISFNISNDSTISSLSTTIEEGVCATSTKISMAIPRTLHTIPASPAVTLDSADNTPVASATMTMEEATPCKSVIYSRPSSRAQSNLSRVHSVSKPASVISIPVFERTVPTSKPSLDLGERPVSMPRPIATAILETPNKKARRRHMSDQLAGAWTETRKSIAIANDGEGDVALTVVNAATTDLSDLINRLDLSATPDCSPIKGWRTPTPKSKKPSGLGASPIPSLPGSAKKWNFGPGRSVDDLALCTPHATTPALKAFLPASILAEVLGSAQGQVDMSTFGRKTSLRPAFEEKTPTAAQALADHDSRPPTRLSTLTMDTEGDSFFGPGSFDSPLRARGKKTSGLTMLNAGAQLSALSLLSHHAPKNSTGTSAFGPREYAFPSTDEPGDVSLAACGQPAQLKSQFDDYSDDGDDSDIPDELQEILSGHSDNGGSPTSGNSSMSYQDISIPSTTSALMARENLGTILSFAPALEPAHDVFSQPPALPLPPCPAGQLTSSSTTSVNTIQGPKSLSTITTSSPVAESPVESQEVSGFSPRSPTDEDGNSSSSDCDHTDDTGKTSFDFTRELNLLNRGGARDSFVEQLEQAFKTPAKLGASSRILNPDIPSLKLKAFSVECETRQDQENESMVTETDTASILNDSVKDVKGTIYSMANLALSTLQTSKAEVLPALPSIAPKVETSTSHLQHVRAVSLSESLDASMFALTNLNRSLGNPDPRHSTSTKSYGKSKPHSRVGRSRSHRQSKPFAGEWAFTTPNPGLLRVPDAVSPFNDDGIPVDEDACVALPRLPNDTPQDAPRVRHESVASFPSMSSVGAVVDPGAANPFGYDLLNADQPSRQTSNRLSIDSDRSSFYFNSNASGGRLHAPQRDSMMSISSLAAAPPMAFRPRPRSGMYRRPLSVESSNSLAYSVFGTQEGAGESWRPRDRARDSIISNYSAARLGRPGVGDKMFDSEHGTALYDISASPTGSEIAGASERLDARPSLESMLSRYDHQSDMDSIFDNTNSRPSSMSSGSVFGLNERSMLSADGKLPMLGMKNVRPVSMLSTFSMNGPPRDDDTMISMLGGDHLRVPRGALGSSVNGSPCARAEKKRKRVLQPRRNDEEEDLQASPNKTRLVGKESPVSIKFGRMTYGLADKQNAEAESSDGNDEQFLSRDETPIFSSVPSLAFSREVTETYLGSKPSGVNPLIFNVAPPDTPPLSSASSACGSQSSIDVERLKFLLEQASPLDPSTIRVRARGQGHRRRMSQISRHSCIESIAEESSGLSPPRGETEYREGPQVVIRDPDTDTEMMDFDDEMQTEVLHRYFALQNEVREIVEKSKVAWTDTDFSRFALSAFHPPNNPSAIQALIEHSQKTYVPLPLELRVRKPRSRANSRPTPYPKNHRPRSIKRSASPAPNSRRSSDRRRSTELAFAGAVPFAIPSLPSPPPPVPAPPIHLSATTILKDNVSKVTRPFTRPHAPAFARSALGWARRKPKETAATEASPAKGNLPLSTLANTTSECGKENKEREANGTLASSGNGTLRLTRARPPRPRPVSILGPTAPSLRV